MATKKPRVPRRDKTHEMVVPIHKSKSPSSSTETKFRVTPEPEAESSGQHGGEHQLQYTEVRKIHDTENPYQPLNIATRIKSQAYEQCTPSALSRPENTETETEKTTPATAEEENTIALGEEVKYSEAKDGFRQGAWCWRVVVIVIAIIVVVITVVIVIMAAVALSQAGEASKRNEELESDYLQRIKQQNSLLQKQINNSVVQFNLQQQDIEEQLQSQKDSLAQLKLQKQDLAELEKRINDSVAQLEQYYQQNLSMLEIQLQRQINESTARLEGQQQELKQQLNNLSTSNQNILTRFDSITMQLAANLSSLQADIDSLRADSFTRIEEINTNISLANETLQENLNTLNASFIEHALLRNGCLTRTYHSNLTNELISISSPPYPLTGNNMVRHKSPCYNNILFIGDKQRGDYNKLIYYSNYIHAYV